PDAGAEQLVAIRVPELIRLILQGAAADVEEDLAADAAEPAEGEDQEIDEREPVLEVGVADRVPVGRRVVETSQGVEASAIVNVRQVPAGVRAEETNGQERSRRDLDVLPEVERDVAREGGTGIGNHVVGVVPLVDVVEVGEPESEAAPRQRPELAVKRRVA